MTEEKETLQTQEPTPATSAPQKPEQDVQQQLQQQKDDVVIGYDKQIATLREAAKRYEPETDEQRRKRERREKSKKIIAAIGDGISALSNLYFTTQYAPNMYAPKNSAVAATDARIEKLKAEREKNADTHLNYALKIGDLERERAKTLRELEQQHEQMKLAREKANRDAERHEWEAALQPNKVREQAGKADKAEQDAETARVAAEHAPELQRAKIATEEARAGSFRASAANSRASAAAHGRSNVAEFSAWDENGKEHKFRTKAAADGMGSIRMF